MARIGIGVHKEERPLCMLTEARQLIERRRLRTPQSEIGISIIVPVHNNPRDLRLCLGALRAAITPDSEIIVVDDGSTDDTASVATGMGLQVVTLAQNSGPAAARNEGAGRARGAILFFVDADVMIAPGAIERVRRFFADHPEHAAVFGSYDARPGCGSMVSRYRNLLHHFVHQRGNPDASTFWAGCGAIRRSVFHEVGGFDAGRFRRPSIEDALSALERLDPAEVYRTTLKHKISMCGLLPTLVVLDTLRRLDLLHTCQPVGYGTEGIAPLPIRDRHRLDRIVLSIRVLVQEHGPSGEERLGRGLGLVEIQVVEDRAAAFCAGGGGRGGGARERGVPQPGLFGGSSPLLPQNY